MPCKGIVQVFTYLFVQSVDGRPGLKPIQSGKTEILSIGMNLANVQELSTVEFHTIKTGMNNPKIGYLKWIDKVDTDSPTLRKGSSGCFCSGKQVTVA